MVIFKNEFLCYKLAMRQRLISNFQIPAILIVPECVKYGNSRGSIVAWREIGDDIMINAYR